MKEARLAAGLSQAKMSEILDIPVRTIEDWESGRRNPPEWAKKLIVNELKRIAKETLNSF